MFCGSTTKQVVSKLATTNLLLLTYDFCWCAGVCLV